MTIDKAAENLVSYAPFCEKEDMNTMNLNLGLELSLAAIIISRGVVGCR